MNTFNAPFAQKFASSNAIVTAALASIGTSAPTGAVLLATGGANGSIVFAVSAMPRATVTASSLALFRVKSATPTVFNLIASALMPAYTLAATTEIPSTAFSKVSPTTPILLEPGEMLYAASQVALAAGIVFDASRADL
ncbi:hypothetical protein [Pseudomonas sp. PS01300]|uniref:hypothetical protein n=1 Tax=Pseudomonas sp. PS01300 TaxID=2991436 RepID=UPI00249AC1A0|nr:hypothetical protein [Pseudomonas sp. PS01300]